MQQSDVLVLPSKYDGWGAVINEAMSSGIAVISSNGVRASKVIKNNVNGLVYDKSDNKKLSDLINYLAKNPKIVDEMKTNNLDISKLYSSLYLAKNLENVIRKGTTVKQASLPPIALLSVFRDSYIGGISVHSTNLYERLLKDGVRVKKFDYTPVTKATGMARIRPFLSLFTKLLRARLAGTRIFHFHTSNKAYFYYALGPLLRLSGAKVILSVHSGYGYDRWLSENKRHHIFNLLTFRFLDRLLFMNRPESERISGRYPFLARRIRTINPFIAPHPADVPPVRSQPHPPDSPFRIVTLGGWKERYNVDEAIRGVLQFQRGSGASVELTVLLSTTLTEPDYQAKLTTLLQRAGEQLPLTLLIDHDGVLPTMAAADLFIRPALIDSYGLCVAESLLVGTPAIATDVCTRCANAILYRQGDLDQLAERIEGVWQDKQGGNQPTGSLLQPEEDAYRSYHELYRTL